MLQCVAVCCSVMQCVAVCYSVFVAVCYIGLQCVAVCFYLTPARVRDSIHSERNSQKSALCIRYYMK